MNKGFSSIRISEQRFRARFKALAAIGARPRWASTVQPTVTPTSLLKAIYETAYGE